MATPSATPSGLFRLQAPYRPTGDQPQAIQALAEGLRKGERFQVLEGVTGSGKTFTMANVIAMHQRPTLVISHNKTLAAQLYSELKGFFPGHAVEYFVSYYDYYQPEAYIPHTDTFIEKDAAINEEIERLRLAATDALMNREDVIIVASVSCIYGLGSPTDYRAMMVHLCRGEQQERQTLLHALVAIQYQRNDFEHGAGTFAVRGDTVDIFPSHGRYGLRVGFFGDEIESLRLTDPLTGATRTERAQVSISPAKHFVMPAQRIQAALATIRTELEERIAWFEAHDKLLEAQRLRMRTMYDLEMLSELGYCSGIENYSRPLSGRPPGVRPDCLLDFFPQPFLTIVDESHVTLPQVRGMFNGDRARKTVLVDYGFRLPSALDNRPLRFEEFLENTGPLLFVSATPGAYECSLAPGIVRQVIRPTGIVDPPIECRPLEGQIDDLMEEVRRGAECGERSLVSTLTKRTAEDLARYLTEAGLRVQYLHSEIDAIARVEILRGLRRAECDCLVGINLLREGLDLPEVTLVAILDADKEGFLRSEVSLIQTAGRAARHTHGRVILYADHITDSMRRMMAVTAERRRIQLEYNRIHHITPRRIQKEVQEGLAQEHAARDVEQEVLRASGRGVVAEEAMADLEREMLAAAEALEFERAALLRDQWRALKQKPGRGSRPLRYPRPPGAGRRRAARAKQK